MLTEFILVLWEVFWVCVVPSLELIWKYRIDVLTLIELRCFYLCAKSESNFPLFLLTHLYFYTSNRRIKVSMFLKVSDRPLKWFPC